MVSMQQNYSQGLMIGLGVVFMIIPSFFVGLRIWAKRIGKGRLSWDDYTSISALFFCIICSTLQLVAAIHGRLGRHQIVDAQGQPVLDDPEFLVYEKTKFAVNILGVVGLGLIKISILLLYHNIFSHVRPFRWAVYAMLSIVGTWTISYAFANLFTCWPVTALIEPFFGNKCVNVVPLWLSVVYTDIIVDVIILVMPIPMVLRLHLPMPQRLAVLGILSLGATVCAISITRVIILEQIADEFVFHYNDLTYYTSPVFFWTNIELSLAVVSSCLPTLRPLWLAMRPRKPTTGRIYADGSDNSRKRTDKQKLSDQYTELTDIESTRIIGPIGVDTTIEVGSQREGSDSGDSANLNGQGIAVHRAVETRSTARY